MFVDGEFTSAQLLLSTPNLSPKRLAVLVLFYNPMTNNKTAFKNNIECLAQF
jgi:hypothetical protein